MSKLNTLAGALCFGALRHACKTSLLILLYCTGLSLPVVAQTPQYFTTGGTSSNIFPFASTATNKVQWLYTPADFSSTGITGNITKVYIKSSTASTATYTDITIRIGYTALTTFPTGTSAFETGLTTVFYEATRTITSTADGWLEFPVTGLFYYDGSQNIVVEASQASYSGSGFSVRQNTVGGNQRLFGAVSSSTGSSGTGQVNFGFDLTPATPCVAPPIPGTATASQTTICPGNNVQLNLAGNSQGTGQTYTWQAASVAAGPYTDISSPSALSNLTVNPTATTFYRAAITCGASTVNTAPVQVFVNALFPGGNYTIDATRAASPTNFVSFTAAVDAIRCGISGQVTFDVAPGMYNEQVTIPQIGGSSAVNRVIFKGHGATLAYASTNANARAVIFLNGADYVSIDSLNIDATGGTYGWGIHLSNAADNNRITHCNITTDIAATTTNYSGIVMSGSITSPTTAGNSANNTLLRKNNISGGYYGITAMGASTTQYAVNNTIDSNNINNAYFYNIYSAYQENLVVRGNDIRRTQRTNGSTFYGVYLTSGVKAAIVEGNRIHNTNDAATSFTNAVYGIYIAGPSPAGFETKVYNNIIYNINNTGGLIYALYLNDAGIRAYHNSVALDDQGATGGVTRGIMVGNFTNIEVKNNVVQLTRTGTGAKHGIYSSSTSLVENNNDIFVDAPAPANFGFWVSDRATLADWQAASGQGSQTIDVNPAFANASIGDLYPNNAFLDTKGAPVGVTIDILRNTRDVSTPDPGAYEILPAIGIDVGVKALKSPVAKACFSAPEAVIVTLRNFSATAHDFAANPVTVNASVSGAVTTSFAPVVVNTGTLASGDTLNVEIVPTFNMTTSGTYTFNASASVTGDVNALNNAMPAKSIIASPLNAGTASTNRPSYCAVGGTPTISLAGSGGGNIQWEESSGSTGPWTAVGTNSTSYTPTASITSTMYYRAVLSCGTATATSNVVTVVLENPQVLSTAGATRCGPGSVTLSATASPGNNINWYAAATGGAKLGTGNSFTTPVITANTTYYAEAASGAGGVDSVAVPLATGTTTGTYFHMFLISSPTGMSINSMAIKANQAVGTATAWDIYYRPDNYQSIPGANTSSAGWLLLSSVTNVPSRGATDYTVIAPNLNLDIPAGATYSFHIVPVGGSTHQYATSAMGTVVTSNANASLIAGHRGSAFNATTSGGMPVMKIGYSLGCAGTRTAVLARIDPPPALTAAGSATVCNNAVTALTVTSTLGDFTSYEWSPVSGLFTDAAATVPYTGGNASTVYARTNTAGVKKYFLNASNSGTGCANMDSVSINTLPATITINATRTSICVSGSNVLSLSPASGYSGASIQWYTSADGITYTAISGATNTSYVTPVLTATTYYKAEIKNGAGSICTQPMFTATVNNPQVVTTTGGIRCGAGTVTLHATASAGADLRWYASATGGTPIGTGTSFTTPSISATTNFYVAAGEGNILASLGRANRTDVTANINNNSGLVFTAPSAGILESVSVYPSGTGAGTLKIVLKTGNSATATRLDSVTVNLTGGPIGAAVKTVVPLNFNVPAGTNYYLSAEQFGGGVTGLGRELSNGGPYPYTSPNSDWQITGSWLTTGAPTTNTYYYFYDWKIASGCESARTAVAATVGAATVFSTQPASQAICAGDNFTLSAAATGDGTLTYQWKKDNNPVAGAAAATLTVTGATVNDAGVYTLEVTSSCGVTSSAAATISINTAPVISTQPMAQTACTGNAATFSVTATGTGLSYQWRKDAVNIGGATTAAYTIASAAATDAGNYDVVITSACGSVTSAAVAMTVQNAAAITSQPAAQTVCSGAGVTMNITATGTGITYQWRKGGTDIPGATAATYTITGATAADAGTYDVVLTTSCGSITSQGADLTVNASTLITSQPAAQTVCSGATASFSVSATGAGVTYQWRKNGVQIAGATASTYSIAAVSGSDNGNYDVIVSGSCGNVTSSAAALTVNPLTAITVQPALNTTICSGTNAFFNVVANGASLTYQWLKNGSPIAGATSATYIINTAAPADSGTYSVNVTGACGSVVSTNTILVVQLATIITNHPAATNVCAGTALNLGSAAVGSNLAYQWRKNGVNVTGATTANYTVAAAAATDAGNYDVVVTGSCGTVTSSVAAVTVNAPAVITTQPQSITACAGSTSAFAVAVSGSGTFTYQWKKGGVDITGANAAVYSIINTAATDAGNYTVAITNNCGTVTSAAATLTVNTSSNCTTALPNINAEITGSVLMPNTVHNGTTLRVTANRATRINWIITDAGGRVVKRFAQPVVSGRANDMVLDLGHLAGGLYHLEGVSSHGKRIALRFIKR